MRRTVTITPEPRPYPYTIHVCWLVRYTEGDGSSPRYWFSGPNRGEPFDRDMAAAVKRDLIAAGVAGDDGRLPTKL